jgi:hypothetical protein
MPKRWFPGHYMQCTEGVGRTGISQTKRALVASNPNIIGYQVSIWWGQTESTSGNYANLTTQLNAIRDAAQADGKKIWLRLFERSFHGYSRPNPVPQYVIDNGWTYTSQGGENIWAPKIWESACKAAFLNWCQAAATYCAANPEFVLVSTEEYTIQGAWLIAGYTNAAMDLLWRDVADRLNLHAGDCLVSINTGWSTVWPPDYTLDKAALDQLVLGARKVVIGPTDLRKDDTQGSATLSTNFGSFMFNSPDAPSRPGYRGIAAYAISYEWPDYGSVETPAEHLRWGVDGLGVHFLAWDPDPPGPPVTRWSWNDAIAAINAAGGRINTARPTNVDGGSPAVVPPDLTLPTYLAFDAISTTAGVLDFTLIGAALNVAVYWSATPTELSAVTGAEFSFSPPLAEGFPAPTYSKQSGPSWANVNSATGQVTGTVTGGATMTSIVIRASNTTSTANTADITYPIRVLDSVAQPNITTLSFSTAVLNQAFLAPIEYTGYEPVTLSVVMGALPPGMSLTNVLSGTPTSSGTFNFTVQALSPFGVDTQAYVLTVSASANNPVITTTSLTDGVVNTAYSATLAATGATPITWSIPVGSLPTGLTLNSSTGAITGTPTIYGLFPITVKASNAFDETIRDLFIFISQAATVTLSASPWAKFLR